MALKRALIVDDSSTAQYRLKKMLRIYPLDIDVVDSGEAAIRYLAHHSPDVIFMDHLMPGMDGFRALQIIKSHPETAMIPVIMYTSKSGDVYTGQARALGAMDVVSKDRINATDLSKVMEAIHITPTKVQTKEDVDPVESPELVAAANKVTNLPLENIQLEQSITKQERIEKVTLPQGVSDASRSLELRLSHLEHSLEDNRRFITSRVVRELQTLKQGLKQEFSDVLKKQPPVHIQESPAPVETPETTNSGWSMTSKMIGLIGIAALGYLLASIHTLLNQNQALQEKLTVQLQQAIGQLEQQPTNINSVPNNSALQTPLTAKTPATKTETVANKTKVVDYHHLEDIAWAFNQTASLAFQQNSLDSKPVMHLHELLRRVAGNGFKGTVYVNIFVGDFCVMLNAQGVAQLAANTAHLNDCMLSSEIYVMDRLIDDYTRDANGMLSNLSRAANSTIDLVIKADAGAEAYPERNPTVSAREWNRIAQNNNRIEISFEPDRE
jgi:CheY-like chemotaxis protein